jgi:hypothetical protein
MTLSNTQTALSVAKDEVRRAQRRYLDALIAGEEPAEINRLYQDLHKAEQQALALTRRERLER